MYYYYYYLFIEQNSHNIFYSAVRSSSFPLAFAVWSGNYLAELYFSSLSFSPPLLFFPLLPPPLPLLLKSDLTNSCVWTLKLGVCLIVRPLF